MTREFAAPRTEIAAATTCAALMGEYLAKLFPYTLFADEIGTLQLPLLLE